MTARLQTMPGIGPITAMAIESFASPMEAFRRGRDFAAWVGLVPKQPTTGGKPRLVVAVALANSEPANAIGPREQANARAVWAMLTKGEPYRDPAIAVA